MWPWEPKPEKGSTEKENYWLLSFMKWDMDILNETLVNQIQQHKRKLKKKSNNALKMLATLPHLMCM